MQIILSANKSKKMKNILDVVVADKNLATMSKSTSSGAKAQGCDNEASNEVVHSLDTVMPVI